MNPAANQAATVNPWHHLPAADACMLNGSDPALGLSQEEVARRLALHGANTLPEEKHKSLWLVFAQQFASPLIYILFVAAIIAFAMGKRGDAAVILVVVFINALIGAIQEGRAAKSMESLRRLSALKVRVRRGGREEIIEAGQLVPGLSLIHI